MTKSCKQHSPTAQQDPDLFECHDCEAEEHHDDSRYHARNKLLMASALCILFMLTEAVGGILAGSLAILTDAAHLMSDLAGFLISVFALWITSRRPTNDLSYGFHRAEILGALLSVFMIWAVTGVLIFEAVQRIKNPEPVNGKLMLIIACIGFVVNSIMACVLHGDGHGHSHGGEEHGHSHGGEEHGHNHSHHSSEEEHIHGHTSINGDHTGHGHSHHNHDHGHDHDHEESAQHDHSTHEVVIDHEHKEPLLPPAPKHHHENLNIRAALIHVIGDMAQSFGVIVAAAVIWVKPEWTIVDPICTLVFAVIVLFTTFKLVSDSFHILMEGTPKGIDHKSVYDALSNLSNVESVHDLHIWSITSGKPALSVHILISDGVQHSNALRAVQDVLLKRFNICHTTIQLEHANGKEDD